MLFYQQNMSQELIYNINLGEYLLCQIIYEISLNRSTLKKKKNQYHLIHTSHKILLILKNNPEFP